MSEDKIKEEIDLRVRQEMNTVYISDIKKDLYGIKKLLEANNRENTEDHQQFRTNFLTINTMVEKIEKRDVIDIMVMAIRKYPKTSLIIFTTVFASKHLVELVKLIIEKI
jgi:hypothetical protein